jgi:hypothetical protein
MSAFFNLRGVKFSCPPSLPVSNAIAVALFSSVDVRAMEVRKIT